ncbi:MAG: hypothetical protein KDD16_04930, partial [Mangrovimonas sp.]|nr:hypothetical protein [Mangrovimonas sp.]
MKNFILKSFSYIFHPVFMPLLGVAFYFSKSPRDIPIEIIWAKLVSTSILTFLLPILLYFLLKNIGRVQSIFLKTTQERIIPLLINSIIVFLMLRKVFSAYEFVELYGFFTGILISNLACLILALLKFKASIHMIALGGVFMFFIALSIHFSKDINGTLALLSIVTGATATSRLHMGAHNVKELVIGLFIGVLP